MITRITKDNQALYNKLFEDATVMFETGELSNLLGQESITSLNEYFSVIEHLKALDDKIKDSEPYPKAIERMQRKFLRLPVDNIFFEIDANSRSIKIPAEFAKNGIGVQSDEQAEILYFTIDRYYDMTDLASNSVQIAIQWKIGEQEGLTRNFGKDIQSLPGKIIFGWPIGGALTAAAGSIQFAVRFYTVLDNNLAYSFSTLPATVTIKNSLAYDIVNRELEIEDYGDSIISRVVSGGIYNLGDPIPEQPTIITKISDAFTEAATDDNGNPKIDFDGTNPVEVKFEVAKNDASDISVNFQKDGRLDSNLTTNIEYIVSTEYNENSIYYTLNGSTYTLAGSNGGRLTSAEYGDYASEEVDLYRRYYTCNINPIDGEDNYLINPDDNPGENGAVGTYDLEVVARRGINSLHFVNSADFNTGKIIVPGPTAPTFAEDQPSEHAILTDGTVTLSLNATVQEGDGIEYAWYKEGEDTVLSTSNEYTVSEGQNATNIDDTYVLKAKTYRNRKYSEEVTSQNCRVTTAPVAPEICYKVFNGTRFDYKKESDWGGYPGKCGLGLAQWTYWSRKQALLDFAKDRSVSIADLQMQLDFMWKELNDSHPAVLIVLKEAKSVREASDAVLMWYEKPADQSEAVQAKRAGYGQGYFEKYAGVQRFINETLEYAREHESVKTILGRERFINAINSKNHKIIW